MLRVGIIGGGQLGQMMILAGTPLGIEFGVLSERADDPAARLAAYHVPGSLIDADAIEQLVRWADVTTYEIEHVNTAALRGAPTSHRVHPDPAVLELVNDKLVQKERLAAAGVPVPRIIYGDIDYPVVQKTRRGGYDGRGVAVLRSASDEALPGEVFHETLVDVEMELAVLVAREIDGSLSSYAPVEMFFDPRLNICTRCIQPARAAPDVLERAGVVARQAVSVIGGAGITAVELFLSRSGEILVNELAPRPHNSGHLTIEGSETSQFEQHLRCIVGLPPGDLSPRSPAVMINLLGAEGAGGQPVLDGLDEMLSLDGVHLHWYGKREVRPGRKMGHVTCVGRTLEEALDRADRAEASIRVEGDA
jgi:5-(carboxyamino)imidazole ribonucleotide synthase